MTNKKIFIVAGDNKQAEFFIRNSKLDKKDAFILHSPEQIYGRTGENTIVFRTGEYWRSHNYYEIIKAMRSAGLGWAVN